MTRTRRWPGEPLGRLAVIGVGQIGGSVALAARAAGAVGEVVGWSRTPETAARARALGVVDRAASSAAEAARGAALVVLATPVGSLGAAASAIAPALDPEGIVMDVGSVKGAAIAAVEPLLPPGAFVACHPIAGTERAGPESATAGLFEGRACVLCPTTHSRPAAVATVQRLWTAMGAKVVTMEAGLHDRVLGAGSHLPHAAAYALAAALGGLPGEVQEGIRSLATTSLRDTTRIAASGPAMWRDIFVDNRAVMLPLIEALKQQLEDLRAALAAGDAAEVEAVLARGRAAREALVGG